MIRSLEVLCHLDVRFGGVASTVPRMAEVLRTTGICYPRLLAFVKPGEGRSPERDVQGLLLPHDILRALAGSRRAILEAVGQADLVHVHGLWHPALLYTALAAVRQRRPLIVSPHGMLDGWALRQKALKKRLMSFVVQRKLLSSASCIRALTHREKNDTEGYGSCKRVEVIPNGVPQPPAADLALSFGPELAKGRRLVTFLGRLHRKKGIEMLLSVWPEISAACPDALLVLAGPDEEGLAREPLPPQCVSIGTVTSAQRWSLLSVSTLFVLPSYSEGFSMAILEALASGCPVLISEECNFPDVASTRCGLVIAAEVRTLRDALLTVLKTDSATLREWGQRGKKLVDSCYSEAAIAGRLATLYESVRKDARGSEYAAG